MQLSPEIVVVIIVGAFQLIGTVMGLAWAIGKFPSERVAINAEARSDDASALKSQSDAHASLLATYLKTFEQLQLRDAEYLRLVRDMSALQQRVNTVEESQRLERLDFDTERERRATAEAERDELRSQVAQLTAQVEELRREVASLKPNNGFIILSSEI